jgi:hypothetical protein
LVLVLVLLLLLLLLLVLVLVLLYTGKRWGEVYPNLGRGLDPTQMLRLQHLPNCAANLCLPSPLHHHYRPCWSSKPPPLTASALRQPPMKSAAVWRPS